MPLIESLTPEQEATISHYRAKWRSLSLSTERMDRQRAEGALRAAYTLAGKTDPEFRFLNGPKELQALLDQDAAQNFFRQWGQPVSLCDKHLLKWLESQFTRDVWQSLLTASTLGVLEVHYQICSLSTQPLSELANRAVGAAWEEAQVRRREELRQQFQGEFLIQLGDYVRQLTEESLQVWHEKIWQPLSSQSFMQPMMQEGEKWKEMGQFLGNTILDSVAQGGYFWQTINCAGIDFCSSILEFSDIDLRNWMTLRSIVRSCGVVAAFEKLCLVIERPTKILLDAEGRIHADGESAVAFTDGSEVYAAHGNFNL